MKRMTKADWSMRMIACATTFAALASMPFTADAEQRTVAAGTTTVVAAEDVASWTDADIDIGAGATLWFEEPGAHAVFTGKITGSGNFVANSAMTTVAPKEFKLSGDATDFTGGFFYTNVRMNASSPIAVGSSAKITIHVEYNVGNGAKSNFLGSGAGNPDYVYNNPLDVYVGANNGLVVNARTVLAGNIIHRHGVIHGPGKITGKITTYDNALSFSNSLHVEGPCSATGANVKISNSGSPLYFKGATDGFSTFVALNCYNPVYLEGDNLFGENVELQMGENFTGTGNYSGRLELNGHSQIFKRAYFKQTPEEELKYIGGISNTGTPATVTFANNDTTIWFYGQFEGHLSLRISGSGQFGFSGPTNTMDGTITISGGKAAFANAWPKLKGIALQNGSSINLNTSAFNPRFGIIDIDSTSTVNVKAGETVKVRRLLIDGADMPIGKYTRYTSGPTSGRIVFGTGTIEVTGVPGFTMSVR